ncbi:metal transporter CNNM4 [Striga asiatica]|uniref:Metal transporter CNNM4 n=1 Tax=Striga asiatica TaxID=4170 RepID=A0A5A7QPZ4_STRAF|nr:metal transporter CNNM4 [Striga asiatica]
MVKWGGPWREVVAVEDVAEENGEGKEKGKRKEKGSLSAMNERSVEPPSRRLPRRHLLQRRKWERRHRRLAAGDDIGGRLCLPTFYSSDFRQRLLHRSGCLAEARQRYNDGMVATELDTLASRRGREK